MYSFILGKQREPDMLLTRENMLEAHLLDGIQRKQPGQRISINSTSSWNAENFPPTVGMISTVVVRTTGAGLSISEIRRAVQCTCRGSDPDY